MKRHLVFFVFFMIVSSVVQAQDKAGTFLLRFRVGYSLLNESVEVIGDSVKTTFSMSNAFIPELNVSYFFTDHLVAEFSMSTSKHNIDRKNYSDLGYFNLFIPSINLQYHFYLGKFKPYLGAGIQYAVFYGEGKEPTTALPSEIRFDNDFGFNIEGGMDYMINDHWWINLDLKNMFINTDGTLKQGRCIEFKTAAKAVAIPCPDYEIIETDVKTTLNPFIFGLGVGYRF